MTKYLVLYRHFIFGKVDYSSEIMTISLGRSYVTDKQIKEWEEKLKKQLKTGYPIKILSFSEIRGEDKLHRRNE